MPVPGLRSLVVGFVAALLCTSFQASGIALAPQPADSSSIWEGTSGSLRLRWTGEDISAQRAGAADPPVFSLVRRMRASFDQEDKATRTENARLAAQAKARGENAPPSVPCVTSNRVSLLSVVGTIVSARVTTMTTCEREAHPAGETRVLSLDLAAFAAAGAKSPAAKVVKLTDYFPSSAVFESLRKDSVVREALESSGVRPTTLPQLLEALAASAPVMDDKRCYAFPDDLLSRFAFHHREGNQVAVRLGLPGAGPCRENLTQIGLLLPVSPALARAITAAASREEGFLMQAAESIANGRRTITTFRSTP